MRRLLISVCSLLFTLIIFSCCTNEPDNMVISSDGLEIKFEVQGEGELSLVFVHGWCCDRSYWDAQVIFFKEKYRVVTIDLPGHGESGLNRSEWTIKSFGNDIKTVANKLKLKNVILVGHSMGGLVILEAAKMLPESVKGLVVVDEIFNVEEKYPQELIEEFLSAFQSNFKETTATYVTQNMFTSRSDTFLVSKIATDMSLAPPEIGLGLMKDKGGYFDYINNNKQNALMEIKAPIVFINSESNPTEFDINNTYIPSLGMKVISNVGHFVMIEDSDTFNRLVEETIQEVL